jgi:hypothetical protein
MRSLFFQIALVFITSVLSVNADTFFLTSESGEKYGPFEFKQGSTVVAGKDKYEIQKPVTEISATVEKMRSIIVPEIDFRNAEIRGVVNFLANKSVEFDTVSKKGERKGVDIVLKLGTDGSGDVPLITFTARYISVFDALNLVTELSGLKWRRRSDIVMVVRQDEPDFDMIHRSFSVLPAITDRINSFKPGFGQGEVIDLQQFFASFGVQWLRGAYMRYVPQIGKIFVANTPENMEQFEEILTVFNVMPCQIETEVQFVEFSSADVAAVSADGLVNVESLAGLRRAGKAELLAAPKVVTKSGQQATVKGVTEIIYPTDFDATQSSGTNTNVVVMAVGSVVEPSCFQTREAGAMFEVMPEISPAGNMINITMTPQIVFEPEWKDYGGKFVDANGREQTARMEQPFFHVCTASSEIAVKNGETVLLGGGMPSKNKGKIVYAFAAARIIGIDELPMKMQ